MDILTHTATGLFLSRAGLRRWTPRAAPILFLAANAPDVDILAAAGGPLSYLQCHRSLTHSLVAMPVLALLSVALVRFAGRKPVRWAGAFCAALLGVGSHLLLDLTNFYGVRLLLPFSAKWFRLDLTNVVDLWIWAVILLALAGPFLSRLVGSEIGSVKGRERHHGRGFAVAALLFLLFYNCGRAVLHTRAETALESRLYRSAIPLRVAALPDAANPLLWRGLVETSDFWAATPVNLRGNFDPTRASVFPKPEAGPAVEAARRSATIQEFLRFSQYPYWRITPVPEPEGGRQVEVMDLRFGVPQSPGFVASAVIDANGRVVKTAFTFGELRVAIPSE